MQIRINISDEELTEIHKKLIKDCLELNSNDELKEALERLTKAAFLEYCKMFIEKGLPTRADEVKQERLFFLLLHYFNNRLPEEREISTIFQLTASQSKTLLRNTKSRYRTKIQEFVKNSLKSNVEKAIWNEDTSMFDIVLTSTVILEELNTIISQKGSTLQSIQKVKGAAAKYQCPEDTYDLLKIELGIKN
jgi:hypothetical protein